MPEKNYTVYPYRWVILAVFMLVNVTIEIMWICFAPISGPAAQFYGVSDLQIGLLAMIFMIVYVPVSLPISWLIDTLGYRKAVNIGVILLGVFGLLRGVFAADYGMVLAATIGLAVAQPFLMNAISTVAARWFPIDERATASGLALVANFLGIAIGQVASPLLTLRYGIAAMSLIYGVAAALSAVVFLIFTRDAPPTPPCPPGQETRALMLDGLKSMLKMKDVWYLLFLFLVGMGIFNGVSTWIFGIVDPRGFSITQAGDLGGVLLLGGILGAVVLPALSDRIQKRKPFLLLGMIFAIPGLVGLIYATSYGLMIVSFFTLGFFLMSLAPIGFQYGAEITYPAPEGTSNGLLNLAGQISVVFIYGMELTRNPDGSFTNSLLLLAGLILVNILLITGLRESVLVRAQAAGSTPSISPASASKIR